MLQCKTVFENLFYHSSSPDWNHFWQPLQKTSSFLATGESIKGRKHMFTVRRSPRRKYWQPFNPLSQGKGPNVSLEQNHHVVLSIFSLIVLLYVFYLLRWDTRNDPQHMLLFWISTNPCHTLLKKTRKRGNFMNVIYELMSFFKAIWPQFKHRHTEFTHLI